MSRHVAPLSSDVPIPFRTRDQVVSRRRSRGTDLVVPTRGARLRTEHTELRARCLAFALMLPAGSAFSHVTAARLLRMPVPWQTEGDVHVIVPSGSQPRRAGLVAHRHTLNERDIVVVEGVRVTSPARTFCDLAESLSVTSLTVVGDHLARTVPIAAVDEMLSRYRARRGRRVIRSALALVDGRSESPKETELRLLLLDAGFGPFAVNHRVLDGSGRFVARVDLAIPVLRVAIEYEGDHHRDREQWRRDVARRRRLEACSWICIPVTQADLVDPRALFHDLRSAVSAR